MTRCTYWGKCWGRIYQGKGREDDRKQDGKTRVNEIWKVLEWERARRRTGRCGEEISPVIPASLHDGKSQRKRRRRRRCTHLVLADNTGSRGHQKLGNMSAAMTRTQTRLIESGRWMQRININASVTYWRNSSWPGNNHTHRIHAYYNCASVLFRSARGFYHTALELAMLYVQVLGRFFSHPVSKLWSKINNFTSIILAYCYTCYCGGKLPK